MSGPVRSRAGIALAIVLSGAAFMEAPAASLRRSVLGSGATVTTGSGRVLQGTVGQAVVGASAGFANGAAHGFWTFGAPTTTAVDPPGSVPGTVAAIEFGAPRPNPSHGELAFTIGLPHPATISLLVADVRGRAVSPASSWTLEAGRHRVAFDPARDAGIPAGIYFARLIVDGRVEGVQRFVRMR